MQVVTTCYMRGLHSLDGRISTEVGLAGISESRLSQLAKELDMGMKLLKQTQQVGLNEKEEKRELVEQLIAWSANAEMIPWSYTTQLDVALALLS